MDKRNRFKKVTLLIPSSALLCLFLYIILHETGHAIVLRAVGADITEFSILSAHVSYDGGTWTNTSDRWMHMNGALFPVVLFICCCTGGIRSVSSTAYSLDSSC